MTVAQAQAVCTSDTITKVLKLLRGWVFRLSVIGQGTLTPQQYEETSSNQDPVLIDEQLLEKAVAEQTHIYVGEMQFNEVLQLRLDYRCILKIDHLWDFTSLARLELNSNMIKNIEGLDGLTNLTRLNLSFNRIEKIEGLESLQKLELLNLSNNKISLIENMEKLEKLTHFSIADNLLHQLSNVLYLRKFKSLFSLNLFGNPLSKEEDYIFFIAGHFPNLMSLDRKLLDQETKSKASIKYQYVLEKIKLEELQQQQAHDAQQSQKAELQSHKDAFVEFLNGSYFFKSLLKDDPEAEKLHCVTDVVHLLQTFEHQMGDLCLQVFELGLAEHKRRETEVNSFFGGLNRGVADYQQIVSQILANFDEQHTERIVALQQLSDPGVLTVKISHCNDEIDKLINSLLSLEFEMFSHLENIVKKLDTNISEMIGNFTKTVQGIFAQCHNLEDNYNLNMQKIAVATLEKVATDELEEEMPDDVRILFTGQDTVMDALATSLDNHLLKIKNRETQLVTRANAWIIALIERIQDTELKRNRMRIADVHTYADYLKEQLDKVEVAQSLKITKMENGTGHFLNILDYCNKYHQ